METKFCPICKLDKPKDKFELNPDGSIRRHTCRACGGKKHRARLKLDFLKAFDSKCGCCGESDPRFLTLDHVEDDGNKHRETLNEQQIMSEARKQGWLRDRYQCLCFNCNCGRSANGGICPHKCVSVEDYLAKLEDLDFRTGKIYRQHNTSNLPAARAVLAENRNNAILSSMLTPEQLTLLAKLTGKSIGSELKCESGPK